jgi:hypothetical protein
MRRRAFVTFVAIVLALVVSGSAVYAQSIRAEIGFPFVAAGKDMPAGAYSVEAAAGFGLVTLTGPDNNRVKMSVVTQLGRHDKDPDAELVFDKVDGKTVLSEIWLPGRDGLLLVASKGAHEHAVVGGSNPRK